jgi:cytochrome c556
MNRKTSLLVPVSALLLIAFGLVTHNDAEAAKRKNAVKQLMLAAHKPPKGSPKGTLSPLEIVQDEIKSIKPDWKLVAMNTKPLAELAEAIKDKRFGYRGPPKPYVEGVALLQIAARSYDHDKGRQAIASINRSCANCHRPGAK